MLFGGRAQYAGILGLTPRYTADLVLILVVVLAGAVRELRPPAVVSAFFDTGRPGLAPYHRLPSWSPWSMSAPRQ